MAAHLRRRPAEVIPVGRPWMGKEDWKRSWKPWLRGTAYGFPFGALPAGGAELPTFLSYVTEKKLSKHPEEFGKGAIEGVAGPEAANNASAAGTLVPMLSLGLPTNATAAVMLTAFVSYGIQPGPTLFEKEPLLIWTLIASLFIGNFLLLVLNLPLAPLWAKLLRTPRPYLYAGILFFATLGAFAVNLQPLDLALLLVFGLMGLMMRRFGLPVLPLIIGVILGPRIERQLRQSLQLGGGDWLSACSTSPSRSVPTSHGAAAARAVGAAVDAPQRGESVGRRGRQGPEAEGKETVNPQVSQARAGGQADRGLTGSHSSKARPNTDRVNLDSAALNAGARHRPAMAKQASVYQRLPVGSPLVVTPSTADR